MYAPNRSMKFALAVKAIIFIALAAVSFNVLAGEREGPMVYVGNPSRVDTIWVPGHCNSAGCYQPGYYIKFMQPVGAEDLMWITGQYDTCGNYVPGHYYFEDWYRFHPHHRVMCGSSCS